MSLKQRIESNTVDSRDFSSIKQMAEAEKAKAATTNTAIKDLATTTASAKELADWKKTIAPALLVGIGFFLLVLIFLFYKLAKDIAPLCNTYTTQNTCNDAFDSLDRKNKCVWSAPGTECLHAWMITQTGTPIIDAPFDTINFTNNPVYDSYRQGSAPSSILVEQIQYACPIVLTTEILTPALAGTKPGQEVANRRKFSSRWELGLGGTQVEYLVFMNQDNTFNSDHPCRVYYIGTTDLVLTHLYFIVDNTLFLGTREGDYASTTINLLQDNSLVISVVVSDNFNVCLDGQSSNNSINARVFSGGVDVIKFVTRLQ